MVAVSLSTSTDYPGLQNALIEDQGTALTVRFDLDEPAPAGGLKVYIDSEVEQILNRLDLPGAIANPQFENLNLLATQTNFDNSGLAVSITEGSTFATIILNIFDNEEPDTFLPETFDGLVNVTLLLVTADQIAPEDQSSITDVSDYTIEPDAADSVVLFADTESQLPGATAPPTPPTEPPTEPPIEPPTAPKGESSNDTIATATPTGLTAENPTVTISSEIFGNFFDPDLSLRTDISEDVDIYSVELAAGDVLQIDTDANQIGSEVDTLLRVFDADGNALAQSDDDFAPEELFNPDVGVDSYIEFTAETAGTYYIGVSNFANGVFEDFPTDVYDPNVVGSGAGQSFGEYELNLALNQPISFNGEPTVVDPPDGSGPAVSFTATPVTLAGDTILANALVQSVPSSEESPANSRLTIQFSTAGELPEDGVEILLNTNVDLTELIDVNEFIDGSGISISGVIYDETGVPSGLRLNVFATAATLALDLDNAEIAPTDGTQTLELSLIPAAGYQADETTFSTLIYDTLADVPDVVTPLTASLSAINTELIESEGNATTLTISLSEPPPAAGVLVFIDSETADAIREFNVFDAVITGADAPFVNEDASGFYLPMTEQTATITVSAFDETTNPGLTAEDALEGIQTFTFSIASGPGYTIAPEANSIDITIADNPDSEVLPDDGNDDDGDGNGDDDGDVLVPVPEENHENELNDTIATATETDLSIDNPVYTTTATLDVQDVTLGFINDVSSLLNEFTDITEDVDMYAFNLEAGQTITLNVEASETTNEAGEVEVSLVAPVLRFFDDAGNEVAIFENAVTEDTVPQATNNASLEFTAPDAGTYYAGVSVLGNTFYDPNVEGSGSGWFFEDQFEPGSYELATTLTEGDTQLPTDVELIGTSGDDTIEGTAADDTAAGDLGNDIIIGGAGDDILRGDLNSRSPQDGESGGNDIIFGGEGNDRIGGKVRNDILSGDVGDDVIWGDDGDDILMGVTGNDILTGDNGSSGSGSDTFVFGNGDGTDTITDFEVGIDFIGLVDGELMFEDLTFTQDGANTLLGVADSGETLAIMNNVEASMLDAGSFVIVPDVSNPQEILALI
ncbi:MAG: pre-peptidase C-terminal domain-containing protein [Cyanobacteria bacterium P01_B01_bin.77]